MPINMEAIHVGSRISGREIVADLCDRIAEKSSHDGNLRSVDSYSRYRAKIRIDLQLTDVDVIDTVAEVTVGAPHAEPPPRPTEPPCGQIALAVEATPEEVAERLGLEARSALERSFDGDMVKSGTAEKAAAQKERRYYTPRSAVPFGHRAE